MMGYPVSSAIFANHNGRYPFSSIYLEVYAMCQSIEELTMLAEQGNRNAEYAVNRLRAKERQCENLRNELRVAKAQLDKVNAERDGLSANDLPPTLLNLIRGIVGDDAEITVTIGRPIK